MAAKTNKNNGLHQIVVAFIETAFLYCRVASVKSLIENLNTVTNHKFDITEVNQNQDMKEGTGPWVVSLAIGDTKVLVSFSINSYRYIEKIEVIA